MCAKKSTVTGVKFIRVSKESNIHFLYGTYDNPFHVIIKENGYIVAEVPDNGFMGANAAGIQPNVNWIWRAIGENGPTFSKSDAGTLKGKKVKGYISKNMCGSALMWIEAFIHSPENKHPTGFFVSGKCTPKIVSVKWHKFQNDNKGAEIKETDEIYFGDLLQLHIETEGLNGDFLEVLFEADRDKTIVHKTFGQTYFGKLIINVPIKIVWRSQLYNALYRPFFGSLDLKVIIKNESLNNTGSYFGKPLTIQNDIKEKAIDKGSAVPVNIGKVSADLHKYEPCLFTSISITNNKQTYLLFEEGKETSEYNKNIEIVAGDKDNKKDISIDVNGLKTNPDVQCFKEGGHKGNIFIIYNEHLLKEKTDSSLKINVPFDYSEYKLLNIFKTFLLFNVKPQRHIIKVSTCRYCDGFEKIIPIIVYPDVEWELAFLITLAPSYKLSATFEREKLEAYHMGVGLKMINSSLNVKASSQGGLGFDLALKYKLDTTREYNIISVGLKNTISNIIAVFNLVHKELEIFDGRGTEGVSAALSKGVLPKIDFTIDLPNIALALRWCFKNSSQNVVVAEYTGAIAFKPLIGLKIGVDLISIIGKIPGVGTVIDWVISIVEAITNSDIYITFEVSAALKGELSLAYNKIDGFKNKGKQKVELEAGVAVKAGIKSNDTIFVPITTKDGITETTEIEKWKVEGSVGTSFTFAEVVGYDSKGCYKESTITWNGLVLTITVYFYSNKIKPLGYTENNKSTFPIMKKRILSGPNREYFKENEKK